ATGVGAHADARTPTRRSPTPPRLHPPHHGAGRRRRDPHPPRSAHDAADRRRHVTVGRARGSRTPLRRGGRRTPAIARVRRPTGTTPPLAGLDRAPARRRSLRVPHA